MARAPRAPRRDFSTLVPRQAGRLDGPQAPLLQSNPVLRPPHAPLPVHELDRTDARRRRRVDLYLSRRTTRVDRLLGRCIRYVSRHFGMRA